MNDARRMFDGYDRGVAYTDEMVGRMMNVLADQGVLDDTAVIISADHGENLGELNIYGDHQTADHITCRVPLIVRLPGMTGGGRVDPSLIYSFDFAATLIELTGGKVPDNWDGRAFTSAMKSGMPAAHRDHVVVSQGAWCVQRAVRWGNHIAIRTWQDALQAFPEWMLFDVDADPHEQNDLAEAKPEVIGQASRMLDRWTEGMLRRSVTGRDPFETVLAEGGTLHANRSHVGPYLKRLRDSGRSEAAGRIQKRYPWLCDQ
jgi:arylsulfatase A-like enzyme